MRSMWSIVLWLVPLLTLSSVPFGTAQELAPSCSAVFSSYRYGGKAEDQTLLVALNGKLVDAFEAIIPPRNEEYKFYYVYQNKNCTRVSPCIQKRILQIKNIKVTKFSARNFVYLLREGDPKAHPIEKPAYDEFHNADETAPTGALNSFHITYRNLRSKKLHTHYPKDRRRTYLFADIPQGKSPWLKARNYRFDSNPLGAAQCIRFTMQLQPNTESALVEVIELEDGEGGTPTKFQQWSLHLRARQ